MVGSLSFGTTPLVLPSAPTAAAPPVIDFALPPPQAALAASGIIAATVASSDAESVLVLKTDFGPIALKTNISLPSGTPVELRLFAGPPAGAAILTANGQPIGYGALRAAPTPPVPLPANGTPAPAAAAAPPAAPTEQVALGQTVRATVVTPAPAPEAPPAGSQLTLRLSVAAPPSTAASPAPSAPPATPPAAAFRAPAAPVVATTPGLTPPATPVPAPVSSAGAWSGPSASATAAYAAAAPTAPPATPAATAPGAAAPTIAAPTVAAGQTLARPVTVPVTAPATAATVATPAASSEAPAANLIPGTIGLSAGTVTVLDTPIGRLSLDQRLDLAPGTLVNLERLAVAASDDPPPASVQALTSPALGSDWPALNDALQTLERVAPGLASQLRADLSPTTAPRLAATLLFFVGVLNGGANWPSDAVSAALTTAGRADLKTRLQKDVDDLRRLGADPAKGDWRVLTLPLLDEGGVQPIRLYVRRDADEQTPEQRAERGSRFVLDLDMSRLGALQLDGLVRKGRFDLVLRSHEPMATDIKTDMASIFRDSLAAGGFTGDIAFVTTARFPVAPLQEFRPHLGIKI